MRFVVDTNIIFSALIKDSITRKILLSTKFEFFTPEYIFVEIQNHSDEIIKRCDLDTEDFELMVDSLMTDVMVVSIDDFKKYIPKAYNIMKDIDEDDTSFLALGLMIEGDGIWSNDPHFDKQNEIKVWKTKDMIKLL